MSILNIPRIRDPQPGQDVACGPHVVPWAPACEPYGSPPVPAGWVLWGGERTQSLERVYAAISATAKSQWAAR